jgi:hypothetical protein
MLPDITTPQRKLTRLGQLALLHVGIEELANVRDGSFATETAEATRPFMSASSPNTDRKFVASVPVAMCHLRLMHRSKIGVSLDHLVGAGEQGRRHLDPQRLSRVEVDGENEFRWLLSERSAALLVSETRSVVGTAALRVVPSIEGAVERFITES